MQNKWSLFQKFLITEESNLSITDFLINALIIIILSFLLERTYSKCAKSLSNRKMFSANFMLIAFTTMIIISIVKSSLALSLGLVGALSIVRFRAAIKEPEELTYIFFTIAMGLGLGANFRYIILVGFGILMIILWTRYFISRKSERQNLFFTITSSLPEKLQLDTLNKIVNENFKASELKRYDESGDLIEASYLVEILKTNNLQKCKTQIHEFDKSAKITFIDNKGF